MPGRRKGIGGTRGVGGQTLAELEAELYAVNLKAVKSARKTRNESLENQERLARQQVQAEVEGALQGMPVRDISELFRRSKGTHESTLGPKKVYPLEKDQADLLIEKLASGLGIRETIFREAFEDPRFGKRAKSHHSILHELKYFHEILTEKRKAVESRLSSLESETSKALSVPGKEAREALKQELEEELHEILGDLASVHLNDVPLGNIREKFNLDDVPIELVQKNLGKPWAQKVLRLMTRSLVAETKVSLGTIVLRQPQEISSDLVNGFVYAYRPLEGAGWKQAIVDFRKFKSGNPRTQAELARAEGELAERAVQPEIYYHVFGKEPYFEVVSELVRQEAPKVDPVRFVQYLRNRHEGVPTGVDVLMTPSLVGAEQKLPTYENALADYLRNADQHFSSPQRLDVALQAYGPVYLKERLLRKPAGEPLPVVPGQPQLLVSSVPRPSSEIVEIVQSTLKQMPNKAPNNRIPTPELEATARFYERVLPETNRVFVQDAMLGLTPKEVENLFGSPWFRDSPAEGFIPYGLVSHIR